MNLSTRILGILIFAAGHTVAQISFGPETILTDESSYVFSPNTLELADLDGDGDIDILGANDNDNRVYWLEKMEDGDFAEIQDLINVPGSDFARVGDMDGDGDQDIVTAGTGGFLSLYKNDGSAGFSFFGNVSLIANDLRDDARLVDSDNDGDIDVLSISEFDDKVYLHVNDGAGLFTTSVLASITEPTKLHIADFDGDSDYDVFTANSDPNTVSLIENLGAGLFAPTATVVTGPAPGLFGGVQYINTEDIDEDGDLDLVASNLEDGKVIWYENAGGIFVAGATLVSTTYTARFVQFVDMDSDGDADMVLADQNDLYVALKSAPGSFTTPVSQAYFKISFPEEFVLHDINDDGQQDIVIADRWDDEVTWFERDDASFTVERKLVDAFSGPDEIRDGDLDADGDRDLVFTAKESDEVYWIENKGGGALAARRFIAKIQEPGTLTVGDFDGDNRRDILVHSLNLDRIFIIRRQGDWWMEPIPLISGVPEVFKLYLRDMNGDGTRDVIFTLPTENKVVYYPNLGGTGVGSEIVIDDVVSMQPAGAAPADFSGDGNLDIAVASRGTNQVNVYTNTGTGFSAPNSLPVANPLHVKPGDIDLDGDLDILVYHGFAGGTISYLENLGTGFGPAIAIATFVGAGAKEMQVGDSNKDGVIDIALVLDDADEIRVYTGNGDASFSGPYVASATTTGFSNSLALADFTEDDLPDFVMITEFDSEVILFENITCVPPSNPVNDIGSLPAFVKLDWEGAANANLYQVSIEEVSGSASANIVRTVPTFTIPGNLLTPGATYVWKVRNQCTSGDISGFSSNAEFTMPVLRPSAELQLAPNPASDYLLFPESVSGDVQVFSMTGSLMLSAYINSGESLDVSSLPAGFYSVYFPASKYGARFTKQ